MSAGGPAAEAGVQPLTPAQLASWLGRLPAFALHAPCPGTYLEADVEALDLDRYRAAWCRLVARHDALRLRVRDDGSQYALPEPERVEVPEQDLRGLDEPERATRLAAARDEMLRGPADPVRDPPFAVRAIRLDDARTRLQVRIDELAADPDSVELLGADLAALYRGETPPGPGIGYLDAVAHATNTLDAAELERYRRYWRGRAGAVAPAPQPPMVTDPGSVSEPVWTRREVRLAGPLWRRLCRRAVGAGLTPEAVLYAAFGHALGGWCKEPRFTILVQRSVRPTVHPDVERLVGCFTVNVPGDVDSDARRPLRDRAADAQRMAEQDRDRVALTGPAVADELHRALGQPATAAALPVLYSCRLSGDRRRPDAAAANGLAGWALASGSIGYTAYQAPQSWLRHEASDASGDLVLSYDTVDPLLPAGLVDDLLGYHAGLLARLADDAGAWDEVGAECLPPHQAEVRARVNATELPIPGALLHEPFWAQARRTPDAPAVIATDRTLSYRQLRTGAVALADRLRELGAVPNRMVAIVMEKGWEQVLAVYGILAAGAAYVPIEPDLPQERFHYLLGHSEVSLALVQPHLLDALPWPAGVRPLVVEATLLDGPDREEPSRLQGQRDLAYVIYTSGSTGLPKGVMIDHRGPLNTVLDINRRFGVGAEDRMLALTPLSFDLSVYDLFGPLGVGGALVMPEAGSGRAPWHWAELVERHRVTLWNTVPALMEMLVGYTMGRRERLGETLRLVMMSGDWIPVSLPDRIRALAAPDIDLISLGGATEASIWSIYHRIGAVPPEWVSIPYGTPLANQHFEILDESLRRRPDWVPGEQYVGGFGVAMGYWRDAAKTRRSFITHPRTGQRLYRTGDLGRYFPDGSIEFLGREDFQVKIHGYRIELGEIEAALAAHGDVSAALVTALGSARGEKRLVAYVTAGDPAARGSDGSDGSDDLVGSLREHLAARLPAYMVPSHIIVLDAFPLTRNGKIDRKALPSPVSRPAAVAAAAPPPDGTLARALSIWRDVTGVDRLDADDDHLGPDVSAAQVLQVHRRMCAEMDLDLTLDAVFRAPTVRALAQAAIRAGSPAGAA